MFWTKRTGHLSDDELSAYIDGELKGARLDAAQRHVASCPECSGAVAELRDVKSMVARLPVVEPARSFVLTPQMAGVGQKRPQPAAPRRPSFAFVPAVALTLLVALFAVDLTTSTTNRSSDESMTTSQAVATDADSKTAADSAGGAVEGQQRSTFSAPRPDAPAPTPQQQELPSTAGAAPPPAVSDPTSPAESATNDGQPVPVPSPNPAAGAPQPTVPAPSTGEGSGAASSSPGTLSSEAAPAANTAADTAGDAEDGEARTSRDGAVTQTGDGGTDWLRIAEAAAAIALVLSALVVFGPRLLKKGR